MPGQLALLLADHATALANGILEEGDGWAVMRTGRPVRPERSDLVPASFQDVEGAQMRQSVRMTSKRSWRRFLLEVKYTHMPYGCGLWPACVTICCQPITIMERGLAWPRVADSVADSTQDLNGHACGTDCRL